MAIGCNKNPRTSKAMAAQLSAFYLGPCGVNGFLLSSQRSQLRFFSGKASAREGKYDKE